MRHALFPIISLDLLSKVPSNPIRVGVGLLGFNIYIAIKS